MSREPVHGRDRRPGPVGCRSSRRSAEEWTVDPGYDVSAGERARRRAARVPARRGEAANRRLPRPGRSLLDQRLGHALGRRTDPAEPRAGGPPEATRNEQRTWIYSRGVGHTRGVEDAGLSGGQGQAAGPPAPGLRARSAACSGWSTRTPTASTSSPRSRRSTPPCAGSRCCCWTTTCATACATRSAGEQGRRRRDRDRGHRGDRSWCESWRGPSFTHPAREAPT